MQSASAAICGFTSARDGAKEPAGFLPARDIR